MALEITPKGEGIEINISNGHLEALRKIAKDYGLPTEKEAFIFMLGVISQANGSPIEIAGSKYLPSDELRSPKK